MAEICTLVFRLRDGSEQEAADIIKLRFYKDRYTSGSELSGKVIYHGTPRDILEIKLTAGGRLIHHGYAGYIRTENIHGRVELSFISPAWSRLLSQNEPVPGLNYGVDLAGLLAANVTIPNVTCESGTDTVNYIYVREHSTIWDAVTAYSKKAYGSFPYIGGTNEVRVRPTAGRTFTYAAGQVITIGRTVDRRVMLSKAYMAGADGEYSYSWTNAQAVSDGIVRERYYPLDRQWLGSPEDGPKFRVEVSARRYRSTYIRLTGYRGEDIFDSFSVRAGGEHLSSLIGGLEVIFECGRAATTVYVMNTVS